MNIFFPTMLFITLCSSGVFAQQKASEIAEELLFKAKAECEGAGHKFEIGSSPIVLADLGGSIDTEAIFDYGSLRCVGDSILFGGSLGTVLDIYSDTSGIFYITPTGYELVPHKGHWAVRFIMDKNFNTGCVSPCWRYVDFDGEFFSETYVTKY